jgi:hypothetical protein
MPIKMETLAELSEIKSEIKVEDYCDNSVAVTANTLTNGMPSQQQQQQQQQQHHQQELDPQMQHQQQNNCWV